jgi:uncharacterized protein YcbK (DUF882 family)
MRFFGTLRTAGAMAIVVAMLWSPSPERRAGSTPTGLIRAVEHHALALRAESRGTPLGQEVAWATALEPVLVKCANTGAEARVRLYRPDGQVDLDAARLFMTTVSELEGKEPPEVNLRTIQLVMKAAYHFKAKWIDVVSAYRAGGGPHGAGAAVDFRLPGTSAAALASFLRAAPRAGVGVYTNPSTQYVHVDARDQSYHWLDASPPGRRWHEAALGIAKRQERDAAWSPSADLPDTAKSRVR